MSIHIDEVLDWRGRAVVDRDGQKIGTFDEIYLDEGTSEPAWAAVKTGPFKLRRRVVPIADAESDGDCIRLPFTKDQVKSAPTIDSEGWVPERDQATIFNHYGVSGGASPTSRDRRPEATAPQAPVPETPGAPEATGGEGADASTDEGRPHRVRLKRYTITETRRSEFGPD